MSQRPTHRRGPRLYPELPAGEVEIPAPPPAPAGTQMQLLPVLLPGALAVGMLVATLASAGAGQLPMALFSFGFMAVSSVASLVSYVSQKRAHRRQTAAREQKYLALLAARRSALAAEREKQRQASLAVDPDPAECLQRVLRLDSRLWERSPDDADWLALRLGLGQQPFGVKVKVPPRNEAQDVDPLLVAAQALASEFAQVAEVPIPLPLGQAGVAGLVGQRSLVLETLRTLCLQLATQHAPDEVRIVAIYPPDEARMWEWLRWLPHTWSEGQRRRYLACDRDSAHALLAGLYDLLSRRRLAVESAEHARPLPALVFILGDPALLQNEPILPLLVGEGATLDAYTIITADDLPALPKGCQAVVHLSGQQGTLTVGGQVGAQTTFRPDRPSLEQAERLARALAPIRTAQAAPRDIPTTVPLLELLGVDRVEELDVRARWASARPFRSLAVPIGRRLGGEPVVLDLHETGHGPHGLVAGTTGSGKSELLLSLVASLAANYHPHEVVFVLIDYKGGGMANAVLDLPHLVGVITNLQGNLATRALAAIRSESQRRQALLAQAGVNHIDAYQQCVRRGSVREPLPHLVIIADEFAELATEQPDFMKELISAVRVGRSLGLHLILATQKPAGVVNEEIWSNARFRICLRVERPEDSQDVLKRPDAAGLPGRGRAYLQVGLNEVFEQFQAAWGGAPYTPGGGAAGDPLEIVEVALDGSRRALRLSAQPLAIAAPPRQLEALVGYLRDQAQAAGIARLRGPWLPPLPESVTLAEVAPPPAWDGQAWQPATASLEPVVGLVDDPSRQHQGPLALGLGREGHLAIYGEPMSGKTTLLQTLALSLALAHSPADVHLYLLDFGGRQLGLLASLPHVGAVIMAEEGERLERLLRYLQRELAARKGLLARAGAPSLADYRRAGQGTLPAIVVMLDNYAGLATAYPDAEDALTELAREGGNLGVHLVLTAGNPSTVRSRISNNINLAVALTLADRGEYSSVLGPTGGLEPARLPGRGLIKGKPPLEFQTALPAAGATGAERSAALRALCEEMGRAWTGARPKPIEQLPDVIPLCDLLASGDAWPQPPCASLAVPAGLTVEDLEPWAIDLAEGPHFLISGPVQSGKTTFLQTWLLALAERLPPARLHLYLVDWRRTGLPALYGLPQVKGWAEDDGRLAELLANLEQEAARRRQEQEQARSAAGGVLDEAAWRAAYPAVVVAIDDADLLAGALCLPSLERLVRERSLGLHLLVAGPSGFLGGSYDAPFKMLRELQTGVILGSNEHTDLAVLNLRPPQGEAGKPMPPGQGYYGRRGRCLAIKGATCQAGTLSLVAWVVRIRSRTEG